MVQLRVATLDSEARAAIDQLNQRLLVVEEELKQAKAAMMATPTAKKVLDSMFS